MRTPEDYLNEAAKMLEMSRKENWTAAARENFAKIAEVNIKMYETVKKYIEERENEER